MSDRPPLHPSARPAYPPLASLAFALSALAVLLPLCLPFAWQHSTASGLCVLAAMFLAHAALLYATLRPNNQLFGPVTTGFSSPGHDEVWLTIDDGPEF